MRCRFLFLGILIVLNAPCWLGRVQAQADDSSPGSSQAQQNDSTSAAREAEESSSKDTRIDLTPPKDDAKNHPNSTTIITDPDDTATPSDVEEMHPWDPHK